MPTISPKILIMDLPPLPLTTSAPEAIDSWFVKTVQFVRRNLSGEVSGHFTKKSISGLSKELCEIWPEPLDIYTPEELETIEEIGKSKKKGHLHKFCRAIATKRSSDIHDILEDWLYTSVKEQIEKDLLETHVVQYLDEWEVVEGIMLANDDRTVVSLRLEKH